MPHPAGLVIVVTSDGEPVPGHDGSCPEQASQRTYDYCTVEDFITGTAVWSHRESGEGIQGKCVL